MLEKAASVNQLQAEQTAGKEITSLLPFNSFSPHVSLRLHLH